MHTFTFQHKPRFSLIKHSTLVVVTYSHIFHQYHIQILTLLNFVTFLLVFINKSREVLEIIDYTLFSMLCEHNATTHMHIIVFVLLHVLQPYISEHCVEVFSLLVNKNQLFNLQTNDSHCFEWLCNVFLI